MESDSSHIYLVAVVFPHHLDDI